MLKQWTAHAEYQLFVSHAAFSLNNSQRKKFDSYSKSLLKLTSLDLDPLLTILAPYYSYTGRPARNHPELFRSFILMLDLGETSIDCWVNTLACDDLLAILIGCQPSSLPPLVSYYKTRKKEKSFPIGT